MEAIEMGGSILQTLGVFFAALIGSALGLFLILTLVLIASEYVIFPLALVVGALLAALCAGWAANYLSPDGTRTQLLPVAGATEVVAVIVAIVLLAIPAFREALLGPVLYIGLACALALALVASLFTLRLRTAEKDSRDGAVTLALIALGVLLVPAVIFVAWLAGLTGA